MGKSGKDLGNKGLFIHTPVGDNFSLSTAKIFINFAMSYAQEFFPHSTGAVDN